ncbi:hypothetical protein ACS0TY_035483 [Phlomoides rotata]
MFYHAFDGYMKHAFPRDELKPLSCGGEDTLGGYALTLIDSLDTLALLGDRETFATSVEWIGKNLRFDIVKWQWRLPSNYYLLNHQTILCQFQEQNLPGFLLSLLVLEENLIKINGLADHTQ